MKRFFLYSVAAGMIALTSCNEAKETSAGDEDSTLFLVSLTKEEMSKMDIRTGYISKGQINTLVNGTGKMCMAPNSEAIVSSCIPGKISRIYVTEGQPVKKGQALFSLSSFELIELQQNYLTAKNEAHFYVHEY